jgi:hypothetical protein
MAPCISALRPSVKADKWHSEKWVGDTVVCNRPELTATERLLEEAGVFRMESEEIGDVVHAVGKRRPVAGARLPEDAIVVDEAKPR